MKANAIPLLGIFEKKMRLEVPLFQRQYVWGQEHQWEPLWEDIQRKFTEYLEGRKDAPVHFLGAMVLDQKFTPTSHVEKRQVIDGQQRLITLQIFLSAFRDFCREQSCEELAKECESFTLNHGMMAEPEVDRFKVWPTRLDQQQFMDVLSAGSRQELESLHPIVRRKYSRKPEPRPRMVEAYLFFYDQIAEFFLGVNGESPLAADAPLCIRLEECFQALKNALQVVTIDLEQDDDAQVIFETLNARGEPLLPADLLRNFIFLRAARKGESQEALYRDYWQRFDEPFWRQQVKQGRLLRPRSELFIQHFLASRQTIDIPIKHLFVEYKYWIEKARPYASVRDELADLARQGDDFRRIAQPQRDDPLYDLATFLEVYDIRTAYPLLLTLLDFRIDEAQWAAVSVALESYLLRRAVCNLTTKNYNRTFLSLTRAMRREGATSERLVRLLLELEGESGEWPTDEAFAEAWHTRQIYWMLNSPKIVHILKRLNETYLDKSMETIAITGNLSVEHIMPQKWGVHWPLSDGVTGLTQEQLRQADENDPASIASRRRSQLLQTIGNLTVVTQPLNSTVSNGPWHEKRPALLQHSLLPINQRLQKVDVWDEAAIEQRSAELLQRALKVWPRGQSKF